MRERVLSKLSGQGVTALAALSFCVFLEKHVHPC
jgi:hypothetical protein